jgi:hypothetical protein
MWSNMSGNSDTAQHKHARVSSWAVGILAQRHLLHTSWRQRSLSPHQPRSCTPSRVKLVTPLADRPKTAIWSSPPGIESRRGS